MSALLALVGSLAACNGGGCPWTKHSTVTASPASSCLTVSMVEPDSDHEAANPALQAGGCVDPVLYGQNSCTDALVLPASEANDGAAVTVAPGASFIYELRPDASTKVDGTSTWAVPATLGAASITLTFTTSGGYL